MGSISFLFNLEFKNFFMYLFLIVYCSRVFIESCVRGHDVLMTEMGTILTIVAISPIFVAFGLKPESGYSTSYLGKATTLPTFFFFFVTLASSHQETLHNQVFVIIIY